MAVYNKGIIMSFFKKIIVLYNKKRLKQREDRMITLFFNAAFIYNSIHSFAGYAHVPKSPTWMCPSCNKVHNYVYGTQEQWFLCGPIFPKCCNFTEGHRMLDVSTKAYATSESWDYFYEKNKIDNKWCTLSNKPVNID